MFFLSVLSTYLLDIKKFLNFEYTRNNLVLDVCNYVTLRGRKYKIRQRRSGAR